MIRSRNSNGRKEAEEICEKANIFIIICKMIMLMSKGIDASWAWWVGSVSSLVNGLCIINRGIRFGRP